MSSQFELFESKDVFLSRSYYDRDLEHSRDSLLKWRKNIYEYQKNILKENENKFLQNSLDILQNENHDLRKINPFLLQSFSINFWRSNKSVHRGPAMYFVVDNTEESKIILYIGETNSADQRWKGIHDCKNYINNYKESISKNNLEINLDIRFFLDVPKEVKPRRKLEKQLIYLWLPPFNKETRDRWITTFTNN
tara:strand:+ start:115 stop:696 length:582 start_codon:yes stop_codon:yes gene_type:complete